METAIMGYIGVIGYILGAMINKPSPSMGLNIRIPMLIPVKGRGFNH